MTQPLLVALVGRPNVGKSTLFNRLTHTKKAIVEDTPGVTRDWQKLPASLDTLPFEIMDTAGLEVFTARQQKDLLGQRIQERTREALDQADVFLYLLDATVGVLPEDDALVKFLRRCHKPIILAMNKAEGRKVKGVESEAYQLGLGAPLLISSAHGMGMSDLHDALYKVAEKSGRTLYRSAIEEEAAEEEGEAQCLLQAEDLAHLDLDAEEVVEEPEDSMPVKLAIVGRPNAGKSTLFNALLQQDRALTGPEAGLTRDALEEHWAWGGRPLKLVDTAGLRKKARIQEQIEYFSAGRTLEAIRFAQVVILVMDATIPLEKQDLTIASHVIEEGRALILALNKWDLVLDPKAYLQEVHYVLGRVLPQVKGVPVVTVSAEKGQGLDTLMRAVFKTYDLWRRRVSTGALNRWLLHALEEHTPPIVGRGRLKIRYITQIKTRPPTFALFVNKADGFPDSYMRYLENRLRETFKWDGVPLRIWLRQGSNPFKR